MRVYICGIHGYLGWSLAVHLKARGHIVGGTDTGYREDWVKEVGGHSGIPTAPWAERVAALGIRTPDFTDVTDLEQITEDLEHFRPDAVVHLAEMPAAPYSMRSPEAAMDTYRNNLMGTLAIMLALRDMDRSVHVLKLATMGEYGTPPTPIPEGSFPDGAKWVDADGKAQGDLSGMMFARKPGSLYHCTKVQDTTTMEFFCRMWGMRSTDVHQGVVYGTRIDAMGEDGRLATRFDYDETWGTAVNRFCAQAVLGLPITPYGKGHQRRGFLPLCDSMQCMTLQLEKPPKAGEYRVLNQMEDIYDLTNLAERVKASALRMLGTAPDVVHIDNPRIEAEQHEYEVHRQKLLDLGYEPTRQMDDQLDQMLGHLAQHKDRLAARSESITPTTLWDQGEKERQQ